MILHISSAGSDPIELYIRDGAQLSINNAGVGQTTPGTNILGGTRPIPGALILAMVAIIGIGVGYAFAPISPAGSARVAGLPPSAVAVPAVPANIPLSPRSRVDDTASLPLLQTPDVPTALRRQLGQPPVVVPPLGAPPAAPIGPAPAGSAFGLEN